MHWQIHKDGRADYLATDGRIEVAVALGLDPITAYSASAPLPKHVDELMIAGFLRGEPVELVKGVTVGVEVPARAEIVLEGYIEKDEVGEEGPFGDHTGYYTAAEPFPVFHVTAMTMRRDAIYPLDRGGQAAAGGRVARQGDGADLPAGGARDPARDRRLRPAGRGRLPQLLHRLDPQAVPRPRGKVMSALWGLGMLSLTKCIVVVDEHVDVHDYAQVLFYAGANVDPKRDVVIGEGPLDHLDHAPERQFFGGKLGIDATAKWPEEGARPWPDEIEMSPEIKELVTRRWTEYGTRLVLRSAASAVSDKTSTWWSRSSRVPTPSRSRSTRSRICRRRRCGRSALRSASSSSSSGCHQSAADLVDRRRDRHRLRRSSGRARRPPSCAGSRSPSSRSGARRGVGEGMTAPPADQQGVALVPRRRRRP